MQSLAPSARCIILVIVRRTDAKTLKTVHATVAKLKEIGYMDMMTIRETLEHPFQGSVRQHQQYNA